MAIATWVLTCRSWFCMSRMTCLIIFSGSSALSIRSFRFARTKVATRSISAMTIYLLNFRVRARAVARFGTLVSDASHLAQQIGQLHARQSFEQRRNLGRHLG